MVSESVLAPLINTAVANGDLTAIRSLGSELGQVVAQALGGDPNAAGIEAVLGNASEVLSLFGWGRLRLERWGDALVLGVDGLPPLDEDNLAVAALLGGLFSVLSGAEVACVPLADTASYMMVDPAIAEQVWSWSKEGDSLAAIASKLTA